MCIYNIYLGIVVFLLFFVCAIVLSLINQAFLQKEKKIITKFICIIYVMLVCSFFFSYDMVPKLTKSEIHNSCFVSIFSTESSYLIYPKSTSYVEKYITYYYIYIYSRGYKSIFLYN